MKMGRIITVIGILLVLSTLVVGCAQSEIDKFITELGTLASNLNAIDTSATQGKWEEAKSSLEQAKLHHSNIDAGIDELEKRGIVSKEIERGRVASTYLHKGVSIIDNMLVFHVNVAELKPLMDRLSEGTKEDVEKAIKEIDQLIILIRDTKSSIEDFLDYGKNYSAKSPDDAKKMKADKTIPEMEQLYDKLNDAESKFRSYIETLSKAPK